MLIDVSRVLNYVIILKNILPFLNSLKLFWLLANYSFTYSVSYIYIPFILFWFFSFHPLLIFPSFHLLAYFKYILKFWSTITPFHLFSHFPFLLLIIISIIFYFASFLYYFRIYTFTLLSFKYVTDMCFICFGLSLQILS